MSAAGLLVLLTPLVLAGESPADTPRGTISLAGEWSFRLDPEDRGIDAAWFDAELPETISLPGSTDEAGFGTKTTERVPHYLNRVYTYEGPAWYARKITIPDVLEGRRIVLFLERCHWETRVWVDGRAAGVRDSLCVPHRYDLTELLPPGEHKLVIRVDNRMIHNVGPNAHSVTDHTQTNWNGIVGRIELQPTALVWIDDVQVFPDVESKTAKVRVTIGNPTGKPGEATVVLAAAPIDDRFYESRLLSHKCQLDAGPKTTATFDLPLDKAVPLWDEFSPALQKLHVMLWAKIGDRSFDDRTSTPLGLCRFGTEGTRFTINGRPTFLRGTLECCIFPRTGYPDMTGDEWTRILGVAKAHGLNHIRFHSWCPPEAAFDAADRLGMMLQVETPNWTVLGQDPKTDAFIFAEGDRILREYGNHPSFCTLVCGNEPGGKNRDKFLTRIVEHWKETDLRRVYCCSSGWPELPVNQYHVLMRRAQGPLRCQVWGAGLKGPLNAQPPNTTADYRTATAGCQVPLVSHEIGQWCVYPNFDEIPKYTGVLRARNFEVFRDSLEAHHMLDQARDFLLASGKLQAELYKEEIESALRTPGFGGFQLLDLHDFPGQGTALVGVVDAFWEDKGYITAEEYHRFCCETVPLVRLEKRTWTADETLAADVEIAHFGPAPIENARPVWTLADEAGRTIASGKLPVRTVPLGNCIPLGRIEVPLAAAGAPARLILTVSLEGTPYANDWDVWVYPPKVDLAVPEGVRVAQSLDDQTLETLKAGGKVLLVPPPGAIRGDIPPGFTTIFWNTAWTHGQPPHTLGILCDPDHPALARFPTQFHSDWQWWDLVTKSRFMILDGFPPELRPIVQVIDDWNANRRLGLVFEAKAGGGKLLVTSIDLRGDLDHRPVARQMLASLLQYMASDAFDPQQEVDLDLIRGLLREPPVLADAEVIHVDSEALGYDARQAIDGNPETIWHTAWEPAKPDYPHEIQLDLKRPLAIRGFRYLPRQDMRNGWISRYTLYLSDDPKQWGEPAAEGTFKIDATEKHVLLDKPREARYLRFVAMAGIEEQQFAAIAELDVILQGAAE